MHIPVLTEELMKLLDPKENENFIDCTLGNGGHATLILERTAPKGKLLGIDWDEASIKTAAASLKSSGLSSRAALVQDNFANMQEIAAREKFHRIHGILFDLGFSTSQMETTKRGFSFQKDGPLDMRYSSTNPVTAEKIVNYQSRPELERILKIYGEERFWRQIAGRIIQERSSRQITRTRQLVSIIESAVPKRFLGGRIHAATRTFQALRIATNNELENLEKGLEAAHAVASAGGRIAVISFHSLEDRIVKRFFNTTSSLTPITRKPVMASLREVRGNPKARSAKLRVAVKS
ncbi:MAG: 16S rRNA (cytosine(1402)-N(4))-methyltransferase RsmH [Parcubacteria group bacterium]|nr:16S rRNA (cytosine(1402)-N(4))-methyltransferase RsmH [Parcubacteria group bacterium]